MAQSSASNADTDTDTVELTPQDYVVLGMVRLGAGTGYEIKQMVELSIRFFWTISHVQIYPALRHLEVDGLIEGRDEPRGKRQRRVYDITTAGERALAGWVAEAAPMPFELRDLGLVKLFFADVLADADAAALLAAVRARSEQRVLALQAIEPVASDADAQGARYPGLTLRLGIAFHQAMVDVCDRFAHDVAAPGSPKN
ncbi:MAG TPA: PadR family transcriptional regulator [Acidimicrobiales bacterium]|nr:PadR family transcriptional regulator [Acidimicrobiales bacterium]